MGNSEFWGTKIKAVSLTSTVGNKNEQALKVLDNRFVSEEEQFDSIVQFSFIGNGNTIEAIELVKKYNLDTPSDFQYGQSYYRLNNQIIKKK